MIVEIVALIVLLFLSALAGYKGAYEPNLTEEELKKYKTRSAIMVASVVLCISLLSYGAVKYFDKVTRLREVSRQELSRTLSA